MHLCLNVNISQFFRVFIFPVGKKMKKSYMKAVMVLHDIDMLYPKAILYYFDKEDMIDSTFMGQYADKRI